MRSHPYRLYGALSLLVILGFVALCIAAFQQVFTKTDDVRVHIAYSGQQLLQGSDVKVRGIIVGSVGSITSNGNGADLHLKMQPGMMKDIPTNVVARLVPKTLFGEKYVDLVLPSNPAPTHLTNGSVIHEDHTKPALEIDQALNDLLPLLRTVQPVKLDQTLNAVATALQGRGQELGTTIEQLDTYLKGFNPQLPTLQHDVTALSGVTRTYNQAADPLLRMLSNLTVTSTTVVDEQAQIARLLADVTGAASTTRDLLALNATNIVNVNSVNRPVISLLARYSPEFPCFFRGDAGLIPRIHDAVPKSPPGLSHAAHVQVEFVPAFPTYKNPIDLPQFADKRGPNCYGLPHPKLSLPVIHFKDGIQDDPRFDKQGQSGGLGNASSSSPSMGNAGTAAEQRAFNSLLGPALGMPAASVPDVADLLWGPMARGNAVKLS
jgi:phospholipid/cholesterol/gamma-HCH transport system substrate-binding protein